MVKKNSIILDKIGDFGKIVKLFCVYKWDYQHIKKSIILNFNIQNFYGTKVINHEYKLKYCSS